jgi:NAD(P)-dependent dehydrogenase (short-subunit alcohol dehydrogenase family)
MVAMAADAPLPAGRVRVFATRGRTGGVFRILAQMGLMAEFFPDVARMVLWLAADDSRMCTAQNFIVDAGWA